MNITQTSDLDSLATILRGCQLPAVDSQSAENHVFFGYYDENTLLACVGVELYGEVALLRSLAVSAPHRNHGIASQMVVHAENFCKSKGVTLVYLLTTNADIYFSKLGYSEVARDQTNDAIKATSQFSAICPRSAKVMLKNIAVHQSPIPEKESYEN